MLRTTRACLPASTLTARFGAIARPLPYGRGSHQSRDPKGAVLPIRAATVRERWQPGTAQYHAVRELVVSEIEARHHLADAVTADAGHLAEIRAGGTGADAAPGVAIQRVQQFDAELEPVLPFLAKRIDLLEPHIFVPGRKVADLGIPGRAGPEHVQRTRVGDGGCHQEHIVGIVRSHQVELALIESAENQRSGGDVGPVASAVPSGHRAGPAETKRGAAVVVGNDVERPALRQSV